MNYCVISGEIVGDIDSSFNGEMSCAKFNVKNIYYKPRLSSSERTIIRCVCYGALADYVSNELYEGANILITGRVLSRHFVKNGAHMDKVYVGCNTVSILEQEEYS
jgi:single-stranded DNA-binding protein